VSHAHVRTVLLRLYPARWRARYGEELDDLMREASGRERMPWKVWKNVAFAAGHERLRAAGLTGDAVPPSQRSRAGTLLVLCAWSLFTVAGVSLQKLSEHWQGATPSSSRGVPAAAFDLLLASAALGSAAVLVGVACALPALRALVAAGGWTQIRRPVARALAATAIAGLALAGLVHWAHTLSAAQRNGHDLPYALAALACGLLAVACLAAWTVAAVAAGARVELSRRLLRIEVRLSVVCTLSMLVMLAATCVWWVSLARSAPWFFTGAPSGSHASALSPVLIASVVVMLAASAAGIAGSLRALRAGATGTSARG
jgi:hypothetical protein